MSVPRPFLRPLLGAVAILLVGSSAAWSVDYYVSSTVGDDTNPGTEAAPFRTLQHCIDQWDGTVQASCHGAGTFHEEVSIQEGGPSAVERNQLVAWDADGDGDRSDEIFILDGEGTRNIGIEVRTGTDNVELGWLTIRNYEPDGGCGDGGELHHVSFNCWGGCDDWWIHDSVFERLGVDCDASGSYISIKPRGVPRLILERNTFDTIGGYVLRYFAGNDIQIRDNTFNIVATGIKVWDVQPSLDGLGVDDLVIERNTFTCDGNGHNDPNRPATDCGPQSGVALADDCSRTIIRDNVFTDCVAAVGLRTDDRFGQVPQLDILVERNLSTISAAVCNPWSGQFLSLNDCSGISQVNGNQIWVQGLTIRNNVIIKTGGGITQSGLYFRAGHPFPFSNDIVVENNTIIGYEEGIRTADCDGFSDRLSGITVRNNIFSGITDKWFGHWGDDYPTNWTSDANVFEIAGRVHFEWGPWEDLDEWRARTGQDLTSSTCSTTFAGPFDYRLDPSDTCARDRGIALTGFGDDHATKPRPYGGSWDIGADEFWPAIDPDLRVSTDLGGTPRLWLAQPPMELPGVRYYRGELHALPEYTHVVPFSGLAGQPECFSVPTDVVPDPDSTWDGRDWYYLAVSVIGRTEGSFGESSEPRERPAPADSLTDRVVNACP